jgi:hypothetical protein
MEVGGRSASASNGSAYNSDRGLKTLCNHKYASNMKLLEASPIRIFECPYVLAGKSIATSRMLKPFEFKTYRLSKKNEYPMEWTKLNRPEGSYRGKHERRWRRVAISSAWSRSGQYG